MSYAGLTNAFSADQPHLGGNIKAGDPFTYFPSGWDYVIQRFAIDSILDLGSGCGYASDYFWRKGRKVLAVEGFVNNVSNSVYPAIVHDLTKGPVITTVDLVYCHEVVEHIEEKFLDNLLTSLLAGKIIIMTHALPGQGGYHHVNEQPSEYWIAHLQARGCNFMAEDSERIRLLAKQDGAKFMAKTGMLFANSVRL